MKPGISTSVRVELPGILFASLKSDSSLSTAARFLLKRSRASVPKNSVIASWTKLLAMSGIGIMGCKDRLD